MSVEWYVRDDENSLVFMLPILKKKVFTGVYAVETINTEDTLTSG